MSYDYEIIQILVLALGLALLGLAFIIVAVQISKVQNRLEILESKFIKAFEKKSLLTESERQAQQQITYKEAIKRLKLGQSSEEIFRETGVSRREIEALSNILDAIS